MRFKIILTAAFLASGAGSVHADNPSQPGSVSGNQWINLDNAPSGGSPARVANPESEGGRLSANGDCLAVVAAMDTLIETQSLGRNVHRVSGVRDRQADARVLLDGMVALRRLCREEWDSTSDHTSGHGRGAD